MRDEYRRGEFESRNRQLPADLNQSASNKANAKARSDFDSTPVGSPPSCYDVRSVFDSRPVNTYDFHITTGADYGQEVDANVTIEMTVPEGYMAILRSIEVWFEPSSFGANRSAASLTMQLNGGDYPNNVDMLIGTATDQAIPMFLLADEFNRIGAKVTQLFAGAELYNGEVFAHFYGNFVLKSGRAYPFEVANPVLNGQCAPVRAPPQAQITRTSTPRAAPVPRAAPAPVAIPVARAAPPTPPIVRPSVVWQRKTNASVVGGRAGARLIIPWINGKMPSQKYLTEQKEYLFSLLKTSEEKELFKNFLRQAGVK